MSTAPLRTTSGERYADLSDLVAAIAAGDPEDPLAGVSDRVAAGVAASALTVAVDPGDGRMRPLPAVGVAPPAPAPSPAELARLGAGDAVSRPLRASGGAYLAVPIADGSRLRGWIAAAREEGAFADGDAHFLATAARVLGLGLARARAASADADDARVADLARALTASLELAPLVERIVDHAHELLGEAVVLWLVDGERSRAAARAGGARVRLGQEGLARPALLDPSSQGAGLDDLGSDRSDRLVIPFALGTRTVAYLEVGPWEGEGPPARGVRVVHRLSVPIASAIENAQLHEEVRRLSLTDPLVQLANRRQLDLYLAKECAAAARGRPLAMVLYDLDRFKAYNDEHGHLAGDQALVGFAGILRAETRAMNLAVRFGGEEFGSVLSGATLEGARAHAERVRRRMEDLFAGRLTVSAGVAAWRPEMERPNDLVAAADHQLYRAKIEGRNRVCVAEA